MSWQGVAVFFAIWFAGSALAALPIGAFFWEGDRPTPTPDTENEGER